MVEEEDASAEAEEVRQERMGLTPDWLIDVRRLTAPSWREPHGLLVEDIICFTVPEMPILFRLVTECSTS